MTNVSFTAMFLPFGVERMDGYEVRHFDEERNDIVGGSFNKEIADWKERFQLYNHSLPQKSKDFMIPKSALQAMLKRLDELVFESDEERLFAYVAATDHLGHYRGGTELVPFVIQIADHLEQLQQLHQERLGRPLRYMLLSDHGITDVPVRHCKGLKRLLKQAGLRLNDRLKQPNDVVVPMYGFVSYGTLYLRPEMAETAARALIGLECIEIAGWISESETLTVLGQGAEARIRWLDETGVRRFSYDAIEGDPLLLAGARDRLVAEERLDRDGFATADDWFDVSAAGEFPDPLRRLVDSLTGTHVRNAATVIFSVDEGYAVGSPEARVGASLRTGRLDGTHGALDRASTLGFFLINDDALQPTGPIGAGDALLDLVEGSAAE